MTTRPIDALRAALSAASASGQESLVSAGSSVSPPDQSSYLASAGSGGSPPADPSSSTQPSLASPSHTNSPSPLSSPATATPAPSALPLKSYFRGVVDAKAVIGFKKTSSGDLIPRFTLATQPPILAAFLNRLWEFDGVGSVIPANKRPWLSAMAQQGRLDVSGALAQYIVKQLYVQGGYCPHPRAAEVLAWRSAAQRAATEEVKAALETRVERRTRKRAAAASVVGRPAK